MGFRNSVLAGLTLIRERIRTPNYAASPGGAGWALERDGSADFAGDLAVGGTATVYGDLLLDANGRIATGDTGQRVEMVYDGGVAALRYFTGHASELDHGYQWVTHDVPNDRYTIVVVTPSRSGRDDVVLELNAEGGTLPSELLARAARFAAISPGGTTVLDTAALDGWTPTLDQGASSITLDVEYATVHRVGRKIHLRFRVECLSAGVFGAPVVLGGFPVTPGDFQSIGGSALYVDLGTRLYAGTFSWFGAATAQLFCHDTNGTALGSDPALAVAAGDVMQGDVWFDVPAAA